MKVIKVTLTYEDGSEKVVKDFESYSSGKIVVKDGGGQEPPPPPKPQ